MSTFVYVMQAREEPICKIGYSIDPVFRAKRIKYEHGIDVALVAKVECNFCPRDVEQQAHAYLRRLGLRAHGEWFRVTPNEALWAIYRARRYLRVSRTKAGYHRGWPKNKQSKEAPLFDQYMILHSWMPHLREQ